MMNSSICAISVVVSSRSESVATSWKISFWGSNWKRTRLRFQKASVPRTLMRSSLNLKNRNLKSIMQLNKSSKISKINLVRVLLSHHKWLEWTPTGTMVKKLTPLLQTTVHVIVTLLWENRERELLLELARTSNLLWLKLHNNLMNLPVSIKLCLRLQTRNSLHKRHQLAEINCVRVHWLNFLQLTNLQTSRLLLPLITKMMMTMRLWARIAHKRVLNESLKKLQTRVNNLYPTQRSQRLSLTSRGRFRDLHLVEKSQRPLKVIRLQSNAASMMMLKLTDHRHRDSNSPITMIIKGQCLHPLRWESTMRSEELRTNPHSVILNPVDFVHTTDAFIKSKTNIASPTLNLWDSQGLQNNAVEFLHTNQPVLHSTNQRQLHPKEGKETSTERWSH